MYIFSVFAGRKSVDVLEKFGQVGLRTKAVGIGNLLYCLLCEGQLLLNLVCKVFVDDGFGRFSRDAARNLCQVSWADVQSVGIKLHIAVGVMMLRYVVRELVKQLSAPSDDARVLWL